MHELRSRPSDDLEGIFESLQAALDEDAPAEKDYHVRTALQHLVIASENTGR